MKDNLVIAALLCVVVYSVAARDKIDVSAVVTKADAEAILGVPVKDPKGRNKEGSDGFYDSEWSYYAVKGDKALVFDVFYAGREAAASHSDNVFRARPGAWQANPRRWVRRQGHLLLRQERPRDAEHPEG